MESFENELRKEFPEWHEESTGVHYRPRQITKIKVRHPRYILPMLLTMIVLGAYCAVLHVETKKQFWGAEQSVANVEKQVVQVEERVNLVRDKVDLVALVVNEDFASIRQATGNQNLLFIDRNWGLERMPKYLQLTEEDKLRIKQKYIENRLVPEDDPELDDDDSSAKPGQ